MAPYLYPVCGLVLMLLTWPRDRTARSVLWRWGALPSPSPDQVAVVLRHLRERRLLVLPLMLLAPFTARAADLGLTHLLGSLLVAWLLAEAVAAVRPRGGVVRTASLARRGWRGLVPEWAVALQFALTAGAAVRAPIVAAVGCVVVYGICWLAMWRPAAADDAVDGALRVRSARVAVGVGMLLAALLAAANLGWLGLVVTLVALVAWSVVIGAPRRLLA